MGRTSVKRMIDAELALAGAFTNPHGITSDNIHEFLVEPVSVTVVWTTRVDYGESNEVCSACGKPRDEVGDEPFSAADTLARRVLAEDDFFARTLGTDRTGRNR
jgi:hypothetical protein